MSTTREEELARLREAAIETAIASEVAAHGAVRLPWVAFPGVDPFSIAWRMGAGEGHIMMLGRVPPSLTNEQRLAQVIASGPVPADWAWWAAEWIGELEGETEDATFGFYDLPFPDVRARLEARGVGVIGEPNTD